MFFGSFSWVMCDTIPCSVILFLDQSDGTSFYHPSQCCEESLPLTAYCPSNLEETFFVEVCALPLAREEPSAHILSGITNLMLSPGQHGALFQSLLPFPCHKSILSDELIKFFLFVSRGSL